MDWQAIVSLIDSLEIDLILVAYLLGYLKCLDYKDPILFTPVRSTRVMPVGVVTNPVSDKIELKTLPEAYVIVRRMTYGEKLHRSNIATQLLVGGNAADKEFQGEMKLQTQNVALWDFANLVVEHNITDDKEVPLNFKNPNDVRRLDGEIGEEIGKIIDTWNAPEDKEEVKNY